MAFDPQAAEFFRKQMEDPENNVCCDCGTEGSTWVSIPHGIYLSIGAAGLHRSLGVKTSFVQSTTMDSWKPKHLRMMELGGNRRFNEFLAEQSIPADMPIREKYSTRAAKWYRENLSALAEGLEALAPLPPGTGHLLVSTTCSSGQHVLDKIFVEVPHSGSITAGGIHICQDDSAEEAEEDVKAHSLSMCERLAACFKLTRRSDAVAVQNSPRLNDLPDSPLPRLLGSTACSNSKRLQILSSGKMDGFGSN